MWTIEYEGAAFERFYSSLPEYEQAVLAAVVKHVLAVEGIDVCAGEWGKPLGGGLYEFRVRRSLNAILSHAGIDASTVPGSDRDVLLRVFCAFHGDKIVLIYHGYDKRKDPSEKRQQQEIKKARKLHDAWKRRRRQS